MEAGDLLSYLRAARPSSKVGQHNGFSYMNSGYSTIDFTFNLFAGCAAQFAATRAAQHVLGRGKWLQLFGGYAFCAS